MKVEDSIAVVYHSEGQVRILDSGNQWEYNVKDHLGNVRIVYKDTDDNDTLEILQNNNYYPFDERACSSQGIGL